MGQSQAIVAPGTAAAPGLRRLNTLGAKRLEDVCEIDRGSKPLGKGSFGTVYRGTLKSGGGAVAVKSLNKIKMQHLKISVGMIASEVELMRECSGEDRFVRLLAFVDTASHFFLVLELCDGGNLEEATESADKMGLGERQVARLTRQLLEALAFLHKKCICHRDVKPQNAMLVGGDAANPKARVKLGDFGLAVRMSQGQLLREKVGTPVFMAPEMHLLPNRSAGYDHNADMWAAGAVLVFLLANEYAFVDKHGRLLHHQLLRGDLPLWDTDMFSGLFERVREAAGIGRKAPTKVARDLVRGMLMPNRRYRVSAARALQHEWFREPVAPSSPSSPLHEWFREPVAPSSPSSPLALVSPRAAAVAPPPAAAASPSYGDATEPLLLLKDFEEGLSSVEIEFQRLAAGVVDAVGSVQVGTGGWEASPAPDAQRSARCHFCGAPSTALNHMCPLCSASVCYACARRELAGKPHCPACGDVGSNAQQLAEYLAAGEAWCTAVDFASAFPGAISRSASGAVEALRERAVALSGAALPAGGDGQVSVFLDQSFEALRERAVALSGAALPAGGDGQVLWGGLVGLGKELLTPPPAALPATARPAGEAYRAGDVVEHLDDAQARWIPARVVRANQDGTFDLDCKPGAAAEHLRRPGWRSKVAVRRQSRAPGRTPAASDTAPQAAGVEPRAKAPAVVPRGSPAASGTCESSPSGSACSAEAPGEPRAQLPYATWRTPRRLRLR